MSPLPSIPSGARLHRVTLENPTSGPDGEGGYLTTWTPLAPPQIFVRIQPASTSDLERLTGGTVTSTASHLVTGPYHPDVTTATRIIWTDPRGKAREFAVVGVVNPAERGIEMVLVCVERV